MEKCLAFVLGGGGARGALQVGAFHALDLSGSPSPSRPICRLSQLEKSITAFTQREIYLETALAEARGVSLHYMRLVSNPPIQMWDFSTYRNLIETGYETASHHILDWNQIR
jgi:hypothetical protein